MDDKAFKKLEIAILERFKSINGAEVAVGIFDAEVAEYARMNDEGTKKAPPRPFMRTFLKDRHKQLSGDIKLLANGSATGNELLQKTGIRAVDLMKTHIRDGSWIPNALSTIKKKKSSKPLIDTGRMINAVDFKIEK